MVADGSAAPPSERRPLRVAIIGAGPAGIFAADALTRQDDVPVSIDQAERRGQPVDEVDGDRDVVRSEWRSSAPGRRASSPPTR